MGIMLKKWKARLAHQLLGDMGVDGEAGALRQEGREQRPVEQRRVVGDDHGLAARGVEVLDALDLDAVEQPEELARHAGHEFLRQQAADPDGGDGIGDGQARNSPRAVMTIQQRRRRSWSPPIMKMALITLLAAMTRERFGGGAVLHDGVQRHGIEAAEEGHGEQIEGDAPAGQVGEEGGRRH